MRNRQPLFPNQNVFSVGINEYEVSSIEKVAGLTYMLTTYWKLFRSEEAKPHRNSDGKLLSMNEYRNFCNAYRKPGETMDSVVSHFVVDTKGRAPGHIVVFKKGYVFKLNVVDADDNPVTLKELCRQFKHIEDVCKAKDKEGPLVSALTAADRTTWAKNRQKLIELSSQNGEGLELIEKALFGVVMSDAEPKDEVEVLRRVVSKLQLKN